MSAFKTTADACYAALLLICGSAVAEGATLYVHCGASGGLNSIGAALRVLKNSEDGGPSTISVSGACRENVLIKDADRLTLAGSNGSSITDASAGALDVVDIRNSNITITGFTIDGLNGEGSAAVDCEQGSHCTLIGNRIQGDFDAVAVYELSTVAVIGGVLQDATGHGLRARGDAAMYGVTVQRNPVGVLVLKGGRMTAIAADPQFFPVRNPTPITIANNGTGIWVTEGAEFVCGGCMIENNAGEGIHADVSAAATIQPGFLAGGSLLESVITGNTGVGVYVGDLSSAAFHGSPSVSGNGQPDIVCNGPTSVSRGALTAAGGAAHTNCKN